MHEDAAIGAARAGTWAHVLTDQRVLRVSGDDAASWLQGQVTNDVLALEPGRGGYGLVLETTGKIRSDAFVHRVADAFLLVLPSDRAEAVRAHFDAHVIMEDVELALHPELAVVTVQGPGAAGAVASLEGTSMADRLGAGAGYDLIVPSERARAVAAELVARGAVRLDDEAWELARIRAGIPRMGVDFGDHTLPQEAGLARRAVSFTKGCYLGQEPVVMLEHRGKPPTRLFVLRSERPLPVGRVLRTREGDVVGRVTSAARAVEADGAYLGLGLVKRAHAVQGTALRCDEISVALAHAAGDLP